MTVLIHCELGEPIAHLYCRWECRKSIPLEIISVQIKYLSRIFLLKIDVLKYYSSNYDNFHSGQGSKNVPSEVHWIEVIVALNGQPGSMKLR